MADKHIIFPTNSPVDRLGGTSDAKEPYPCNSKLYKETSARLLRKLSPLLQARKEADKVYSKGYFENHYPEADKQAKRMLHSRVMNAWANALNDMDDEQDVPRPGLGGGGGATIIINVGG
jgi:hypothetical protein